MNKPAARKLLRHLMKQRQSPSAARFNMRHWGGATREIPDNDILEQPICNTQACMAGETVLALNAGFLVKRIGGIRLYSQYRVNDFGIQETAAKLLDLTEDEQYRLFYFKSMGYRHGWPKKYEDEYKNAKTPFDRLMAAIHRLSYFIATNGRK